MNYSVEELTVDLNRALFDIQERVGDDSGGDGRTARTLAGLHEIWMEAVAAHPDPLAAVHEEVARTVPWGHSLGPGPGSPCRNC